MIQKTEHLIKEAVETVVRGFRRQARGRASEKSAVIVDAVLSHGYSVIEDFWSADHCGEAIEQIECALQYDTDCHYWSDDLESDRRLYFAERLDARARHFLDDPAIEDIRRHYTGVRSAEKLLLAAQLRYVAGNSGSGGGWHRDSPHRSQFKAILYLSDVNLTNGPFEYIDGSHRSSQSVKMLLDKQCRPNQYRFSDEEICRVFAADSTRRTFAAPAGTLLIVDSKGIHRGKPIEAGYRYALTQYCFDGKRPRSFLK